MSYAVVRGAPYASQLYLDEVLEEVLRAGGCGAKGGEGVSLPQILFYCLRKNPEDVFMINGVTGQKITKSQILKKAISVARALLSVGARGKIVMVAMRNHQTMLAVYFAVMFAGTVPFMMIPSSTVFEITHFLKLIEPNIVICDEEHYSNVNTALQDLPKMKTEVKMVNRDELLTEMVDGFSGDAEDFQILDVDVDSTAVMITTSGSTGFPKASIITHRGLIPQLPIAWNYRTEFPLLSECCMLLSTPERSSFHRTVCSCVVFRVPLLMSQRKPTVDWVKEMLITYKPSWTLLGTSLLRMLLPTLTKEHLSSVNYVIVHGSPPSMELLIDLKKLLPPSAVLRDSYGTTEAQGTIAASMPGAPLKCTGQVINLFEYKLVDEDGNTVGKGQNGELYVKNLAIKGYYNNKDMWDKTFTPDGWFKTGDLFHINDSGHLYYLKRLNFSFNYLGHVSPEEVEQVICSVRGVQQCVVCGSTAGPAALVVRHDACPLSRDAIHQAVNDNLSENKRLHGGIAFVSSLPHTHSGKIQRAACKTLMQKLLTAGECF